MSCWHYKHTAIRNGTSIGKLNRAEFKPGFCYGSRECDAGGSDVWILHRESPAWFSRSFNGYLQRILSVDNKRRIASMMSKPFLTKGLQLWRSTKKQISWWNRLNCRLPKELTAEIIRTRTRFELIENVIGQWKMERSRNKVGCHW